MALSLANVDYEHREVLLRDKPEHMLQLSPKGSVPVFWTNGTVLDESIDIMAWALPGAKFEADIIQMIDGPFKHHLDHYKYASRYDPSLKRGDIDLSHRGLAVEAIQSIETGLADTAYLGGSAMGPTDMAAFPFVRQFAAVQQDWWSAGAELPLTRDWLAKCVSSDLFQTIMQKYPLWELQN